MVNSTLEIVKSEKLKARSQAPVSKGTCDRNSKRWLSFDESPEILSISAKGGKFQKLGNHNGKGERVLVDLLKS
jgi:hypothetical protein